MDSSDIAREIMRLAPEARGKMAEEKELRRMNRTELIEIIYVLQQQEQDLRREIGELSERLDDRAIRLESAGSIAEAALSLNNIFEDAQAAAEQYLSSARSEADEILKSARTDADGILSSARLRADDILIRSKKEAANERDKFLNDVRKILDENPELAAALQERARRRITGDERENAHERHPHDGGSRGGEEEA